MVQRAAATAEATAATRKANLPQSTDEVVPDNQDRKAVDQHDNAGLVAQQFLEAPAPPPRPQTISTFWLAEGNTLASNCRFAGMPKMLCLHEVVEAPKIVTDVMISAACPLDVMVASRVALNFDWLVYAPAGKGAEVHAAALPLNVGRAFTVAISRNTAKGEEVPLDIRCGVTTVWKTLSEPSVAPNKNQ